jgi:hypothetical protein
MKNQTFEIKISGSGTASHLESALAQVLRDLRDTIRNDREETLDGAVWEDSVLITEIKSE